MYDLAVFTALAWERRAVLGALREAVPAAAPRTWAGRLGDGASCLVVQTGVGPERARRAAMAAPPARLMASCGCAGGLAARLRAGEIVIADEVVDLDPGARPSERLPAAAAAIGAWTSACRLAVHVGAVGASPHVLATPDAKRAAAASGVLAVDMESGALARAARARDTPVVVVRVVLDTLDDALTLGSEVVDAETGTLRGGRLLVETLPPWRWPAVARLARRSRQADHCLRAFLARLFGEGGMAALTAPHAG